MATSMMPNKEFRVQRCEPELIGPASPTPRELKPVSDIDDQEGLRFLQPVVHFYASDPSKEGIDPVKVIREALAQALVSYYPLAGRLREGPARKLSVDCTAEGVLFVEADADVELKHFGDLPEPPFPCIEELLHDVPGSSDILDFPLIHFQVTRLKCNGFIVALRFNHTVADGFGLSQFLNSICEIARGASAPSIPPVWERQVFKARDEPHVTFPHPEYDKNTGPLYPFPKHDHIVERSFFFGSSEVSAIQSFLPNQSTGTKFEVLTAYLWRSRTRALELDPEDEVRLHFTVNSRGKIDPPLPVGYYGIGFALVAAVTTAEKLSESPLEYAVNLVRATKPTSMKEYMQSTADLMAIKGRPYWSMKNSYVVSDTAQLRLDHVDYGWGKPTFGGPPKTEKGLFSYYVNYRNKQGEVGRLVTVGLPAPAMTKFTKELDTVLRPQGRTFSRVCSMVKVCIK